MNPELPGTYINLIVETVKRWGVSCEQLLDGSGIRVDQLKKPYWYVEFNTLNQLKYVQVNAGKYITRNIEKIILTL